MLPLKGIFMESEFSITRSSGVRRPGKKVASPSTDKSRRIMLLAVLFQVSWPKRLTKQEIIDQLPMLYGDNPNRALYRDIETLTDTLVDDLPEPDAEHLADWCNAQQQRKRLAITYQRRTFTFGLAQSIFSIDISEDEARAFVALQEGFTPGTPYADAVQQLLIRWQWLFSEKSHQLVRQKRKRHARPVLLPLSPVVDYSQHGDTILLLDHTEPYELEYRDGHWYYTAYISDLNTFIDYRVDRIRPGSLRKEHDHFYPGGRQRPGVKIRYWLSPMLARHGSLSARLREQQVTLLEDDQGAIVEGYAKSLWWARRLLLGYGEQVKALAPKKFMQMMHETAQAMSQLYEEEK